MKFGYIRVSSTNKQINSLETQRKILLDNGILDKNIYADKYTGTKMERPELDKLLNILRDTDELYVFKLDRLGRNVYGVYDMLKRLKDKSIIVYSISEGLSTATKFGEALLQIAAVFAEMEKNFIDERRNAGLLKAKETGKHLGRRPGLSEKYKRLAAECVELNAKGLSLYAIARYLKLCKNSVYKYLRMNGIKISKGENND